MISAEQLTSILALLEKAGSEIMAVYKSSDFGTRIKDDDSPVTVADLAADRIIKEGLMKITPGIHVFSEETKEVDYSVRSGWDPLWILDPLDGTKEFIARNDEFCISLALSSGRDITAGFIHAPVTGVSWYAISGKGAWKSEKGRKLRLPLGMTTGAYRVNISRTHHTQSEELWIANLRKRFEIVIDIHGSAIKFCKMAEGVSDIYPKFSTIHEWDIAAGHLILEESGGAVIELPGLKPPVYNKESYYQPPFIAFSHRIEKWRDLLKDLETGQP